MLKFHRTDRIDFLKYQDYITSTGYIYIDPTTIPSHMAYESSRIDGLNALAIREMVADGGFRYGRLDKDTVIEYLTNVKHVDEKDLSNRKNKNQDASVSKKVLEPLLNKGVAANFISLYLEHSSAKFVRGRIEGTFRRLIDMGEKARNGNGISRLKYSVGQTDNFRYSYSSDDIISIPKSYTTTFTVPDGYFLAWGDLKQSDFRIACNLLIIDETNYHYFDNSDDWYYSMYRLLCDFFNRQINEEDFKLRRNTIKTECLAAMYGATKGQSAEGTEFIQEFRQYLDQRCPRYKEFQARIEKYREYKVPITIDTYFGNQVSVSSVVDKENESYIVGADGIKLTADSVLTQALNTPFQSGTSEVVIKIVTAIIDKFYSLGYTEEDVRVYVVRHDEPVFMLSEKAIKDAWVLDDCTQIYVDSWRPLGLEFSYGYYYGVKDEKLTETIEQSIRDNADKISFYEPDQNFVPYMPLKRIKKISLGYSYITEDRVFVTLYDRDRNEAVFFTVNSEKGELDGQEVEIAPWKVAIKVMEDYSPHFLDKGIEDVLVDTYFKFPPHMLKSSLLLVPNFNTVEASIANSISDCKTWIHCEREGFEFMGDMNSVEAGREFAERVNRVEYLQG